MVIFESPVAVSRYTWMVAFRTVSVEGIDEMLNCKIALSSLSPAVFPILSSVAVGEVASGKSSLMNVSVPFVPFGWELNIVNPVIP